MSLVTSDIELLEVFYAHTISPIAIAVVCVAAMEALFASMAFELALVALVAYVVLGVALPLVASRACGDAGRESREAVGATSAYVLDGLRGLAESIQYAGTAQRERGLDALTAHAGEVDARLQRRQAASECVADGLIMLSSLIMLECALRLVAAQQLDFGRAFVATFAFFSSFGPVMAVSRLGASLQATLASGARVLNLIDEEPETPEVCDGMDVAFHGAELERVSFAYGRRRDAGGCEGLRGGEVSWGETPSGASGSEACFAPARDCGLSAAPSGVLVLSDVSCKFPAGEMVCVSGRSGSGKSTLLKLLMRFWEASSGEVRVSGEDVRHINTASLRAAEAYMTQETQLFVGTLRDNLLVARADATDEELDHACEAAALTSLVGRLPQGYDTSVAELGESLSGGERQRIGLARVFLSGAPFVLLDEPTSALDALNEAAVMRSVAQLRSEGKTVVLVSHRASTCAFADRFVSVEHGRMS